MPLIPARIGDPAWWQARCADAFAEASDLQSTELAGLRGVGFAAVIDPLDASVDFTLAAAGLDAVHHLSMWQLDQYTQTRQTDCAVSMRALLERLEAAAATLALEYADDRYNGIDGYVARIFWRAALRARRLGRPVCLDPWLVVGADDADAAEKPRASISGKFFSFDAYLARYDRVYDRAAAAADAYADDAVGPLYGSVVIRDAAGRVLAVHLDVTADMPVSDENSPDDPPPLAA